jgi:predicted NAD/FAD-binding protein
MKIAVVGSGISGLSAAYYLSGDHEVHLYEADRRLGGHTATIDVRTEDESLAIDTGFIVFNDWTYPNFIALMDELGVASQPTSMSFSVSDRQNGLEYAGSSLDTLFAQRRNVVSPRFLRMLWDILRFNTKVEQDLAANPALGAWTLGQYLREYGYSTAFCNSYLVPMGAAIWSSGNAVMDAFPLEFFIRFFRNHGLLNIRNRPQWRFIRGGSRQYIDPLSAPYRQGIRLNAGVRTVMRRQLHQGRLQACVSTDHHHEYYDEVVFACHSDQALRLLGDASEKEKSILGAIPYTKNKVVLHRDTRLLPHSRKVWSSWNVLLQGNEERYPVLTYNMNILQQLQSRHTWCVTLNSTDSIDPKLIHSSHEYEHPLFTLDGIRAQQRWQEINGVNQTWFCGAWWRYGFHEDGVWSAKRVADTLKQQQVLQLAMAG